MLISVKLLTKYGYNDLCIRFGQERIKGTEKASPIHTLLHR